MVFQPFVSQSRRTSALDLGLAFASAIVEWRGGAMAIGCDVDTCMIAYLPMHVDLGGTAEAGARDENASQVIVVDPAAQWGAVTASLLSLLDWPVKQVGSVAEAAALLTEAGRGHRIVVIRVPLKSLEAEAAARLQAVIARRAHVDLVMMVGPLRSMAVDEAAANILSELAMLALTGYTTPADIVNYLIPNI